MSTDMLAERFKKLTAVHGNNWKQIAEVLNKEGIAHPKGKSWTRDNARTFYRSVPRDQVMSPLESEQALPEWLDDAAVQDLQDMLEWWRTKKDESLVIPPTRPVFKGERRNTGVHVNKEILKRVMQKLKTDKVRTGGSLSLLTEYLYWEYLGRPRDVLEPVLKEESDAWSVLHETPVDDFEV
jgi:hypothetical protein